MEIRAGLLCMIMALSQTACQKTWGPAKSPSDEWITGTVKYIPLEGGFYGIVGDQGQRFDPVDLPEAFETDGLRVKCRVRRLPERASVHMWGQLVEVIDVDPL